MSTRGYGFVAGPPVSETAFFGRKEELDRLMAAVRDGISSLIIGQRRVGKTSLLSQLRYLLLQESATTHLILSLDGEAFINSSHEEFVRAVIDSIISSVEDRDAPLGEALRHMQNDPSMQGRFTWQAAEIMKRLQSANLDVLLLLDEADALIHGSPYALLWVRSLISQYRMVAVCTTHTSPDEIKTVGPGSSPWFNIYLLVRLGMFKSHEAADMLSTLSARSGKQLNPGEVRFLLHLFGAHPFLLQLAGYTLFKQFQFANAPPEISASLLRRAVRETIDQLAPHFAYLVGHLLPEERAALREVARGKEPRDPHLLRRLEAEGLIQYSDDGWNVSSAVLAEFISQLPERNLAKVVRSSAPWRFVGDVARKTFDIAVQAAVEAAAKKFLT